MGTLTQIVRETRAQLAERFPNAIAHKGGNKRPLKIGIHRDVAAALPDLPSKQIGLALRDYVNGNRYLHALVAGANRIDLDGNVCGVVTGEQAAVATRILERHLSKQADNWRRKRAAEKAAADAAEARP